MPSGGDPIVGIIGDGSLIALPGATLITPDDNVQYVTGAGAVPQTPASLSSYPSMTETNTETISESFYPSLGMFGAPPKNDGFSIGTGDTGETTGDPSAGDAYTRYRQIASNNLFVRSNYRYRGTRDSTKMLSFMQKTTGTLIRSSNNLENYDLNLTTSEGSVYPSETEICQLNHLNTQATFFEWQRLRQINARWLV